jgi:hypothetical protein
MTDPVRPRLDRPVSILMPVRDERDVIEGVVDEWARDVVAHLPPGSELVFDECSEDGTGDILNGLTVKYPWLVVHRSPRDGFDRAAARLYAAARCPLLFFTDSDGQYVAAEFWRLVPHLPESDMVHGAKMNRQDPLYRRAASAFFNQLVAVAFGFRGRDVNSAFRLIRRELVTDIVPQVRKVPVLFNAELYIRAQAKGYRITNVDVAHRPREHGASQGLPSRSFARACWNALKGLRELRRELRAQ